MRGLHAYLQGKGPKPLEADMTAMELRVLAYLRLRSGTERLPTKIVAHDLGVKREAARKALSNLHAARYVFRYEGSWWTT